jgi:quercetin dioxygenase-like cupin family protein
MPIGTSSELAGYVVDSQHAETIAVLGPTIQYLTPPEGDDREPCVMRGRIPPGVVVPLHSHADPETFFVVSGRLEALAPSGEWVPVRAGDVFHVPGDAKHAWRNTSPEPAVTLLVSTVKIGRFFREVAAATADADWPPQPAVIERFLAIAERYGYWNATPEENAAVGLHLA